MSVDWWAEAPAAAIAVLSALMVVLARQPLRAAFALLLHIVALSVLYLGLEAQLLAVLQLLVYAGAVVVLFLFVIMLLGPTTGLAVSRHNLVSRTATLALMAMVGVLLLSVVRLVGAPPMPETYCLGVGEACVPFGGVQAMAYLLFADAFVLFELMGVLLTVAVVGAIAVAGSRRRRALAPARLPAATVSPPAAASSAPDRAAA